VGKRNEVGPPRKFKKLINKNAVKSKMVYSLEILPKKNYPPSGILAKICSTPPGFSTVCIYEINKPRLFKI
jgi:hypothetical protein